MTPLFAKFAKDLLDAEPTHSNSFCQKAFEYAEDFVNKFGSPGFVVYTFGETGGTEKEGLSVHDDDSFTAGGLKAGWFRNGGLSTFARGALLRSVAIHEGGHLACDEGDFGCSGLDEEELQEKLNEDCGLVQS